MIPRPQKMTQGERLVWAQVFAADYRKSIKKPPREVSIPGKDEEWLHWEQDQAASAAETACAVVERMRGIGEVLDDGYGIDGDVTSMWEQMIDDDWNVEEAYQRRVKAKEEDG